MQRTAQDWVVLTELTHHSATAVGITSALQFGPQLLLLPLTGYCADRFDRRRQLVITQAMMALLALVLGLLLVTGAAVLWHVYVCAGLLGCVAAFDAPLRHSFVPELVGEEDLSNAVSLNSASFHAARLVGPAVAGVVIAAVGSGWAFLVNALSYVAMLAALAMLRRSELRPALTAEARDEAAEAAGPGIVAALRYVRRRPDLMALLTMFVLVGMFGFNFAIYISTMAVSVFHVGAQQFGLLSSLMAVGAVSGALVAAARARPRVALIVGGAGASSIGFALAAVTPTYWTFGAALIGIGVAAQTFTATVNSYMQLATAAVMRGRVMAITLASGLGGAALGGPIVGWITDLFGPRAALGSGAIACAIAVYIALRHLRHDRALRVRVYERRLQVSLTPGYISPARH